MIAHRPSSGGFTMMTGLLILVGLAILGTAMLTFSGLQQSASALDVSGARAYAAASSGAEWGAYQALRLGSCAAAASPTPAGTLATFTVAVQCTAQSTDEAGVPRTSYTITSTACTQAPCPNPAPTADYVERQVIILVGT